MRLLTVDFSRPTQNWDAHELRIVVFKHGVIFGVGRIYKRGWTIRKSPTPIGE